MMVGELVDQLGGQTHGAGLVVLGVGLGQHPLAGGGVLDRDLDDGLLDGQPSGGEVEVAGFEGDELAPAQAGVDRGLHHQPVLRREGGEDGVVLVGGEGAGLLLDHLGQLGVGTRVEGDDPVAQGAFEDRVQHGVVLADRGGGEAVLRWRW